MNNAPHKLLNCHEQKNRRNALRRHATPAEKELWKLLKNSQVEGLKFRRQYSVGPYIVDFYCPKLHLAIELDGQVHVGNEEYDEQRSLFIEKVGGISILRYENKFVFEHPDCIIDDIKEYMEGKEL
ncbi:DUF559 domain-containing protein [Parabacteroides sp. OttesenSCG-928-K15]|nr:DUF559 domain-containing protein [Parabacteroides sp. OttesenSCG-928-K15]